MTGVSGPGRRFNRIDRQAAAVWFSSSGRNLDVSFLHRTPRPAGPGTRAPSRRCAFIGASAIAASTPLIKYHAGHHQHRRILSITVSNTISLLVGSHHLKSMYSGL
jgi:hypothetical protein